MAACAHMVFASCSDRRHRRWQLIYRIITLARHMYGVYYTSFPSHASHTRDFDHTNYRDLNSSQPTVPFHKAAAGSLALISLRLWSRCFSCGDDGNWSKQASKSRIEMIDQAFAVFIPAFVQPARYWNAPTRIFVRRPSRPSVRRLRLCPLVPFLIHKLFRQPG